MTEESTQLANMLETAEAEYLYARVELICALPDNPHDAAVRRDGPLRSLRVADNSSPMNNRICGLHHGDEELPPDLLAWFGDGAAPGIPVIGTPEETADLAARFSAAPMPSWTHGQMIGRTEELPVVEPAHPVRKLELGDMPAFAEVHANAFGPRGRGRELPRDMFSALIESGRTEAFAVDDDEGHLAGIGLIFYAENDLGYLATAATARPRRREGIHSALIARRIEAARERGCPFVAATALPTSQSCVNLTRAGLSRSHMQTILRLT